MTVLFLADLMIIILLIIETEVYGSVKFYWVFTERCF